jgi:hypothetical protein
MEIAEGNHRVQQWAVASHTGEDAQGQLLTAVFDRLAGNCEAQEPEFGGFSGASHMPQEIALNTPAPSDYMLAELIAGEWLLIGTSRYRVAGAR